MPQRETYKGLRVRAENPRPRPAVRFRPQARVSDAKCLHRSSDVATVFHRGMTASHANLPYNQFITMRGGFGTIGLARGSTHCRMTKRNRLPGNKVRGGSAENTHHTHTQTANHLPRQACEAELFGDDDMAFMRLKAHFKNKVRRSIGFELGRCLSMRTRDFY